MIFNRSTNKIIIGAVAALNKAVKAHAYSAMLTGFKVKSKAQFIANVISAKISLPSWYGDLPKSKAKKHEAANSFWDFKFRRHTLSFADTKFSYIKPKKSLGYGAILQAAGKLGQFSWAELLLSIPYHAERIQAAYTAWGKLTGYKKSVYRNGVTKQQYISFKSYANNYFNSYRSYFVRNRILAKVKGKRGIYTLTPNGKLLLSGMKQLDTMH